MPSGVYNHPPQCGFQKGHKMSFKNGKTKYPNGYILIYKPNHPFRNDNGYVREHRFAIEQIIGRYLKPSEICHHINGIRDDNRPENLMAFINKSAHQRFHKNPDNVKPEEIIFDGRKKCQGIL